MTREELYELHERWYEGHRLTDEQISAVLILALDAFKHWIPMKELQPADFERVLCVNSNGYMTTANRFHDTKLDCWNGSDYTAEEQQELVIGGITHWMKLPDMPLPQEEKP